MKTKPTKPGATVLIVDDDAEVTNTFSKMLRLSGYQVRAAGDPERGLQETLTGSVDAIILDLRMPLFDGVDFLRRLRSDPARRGLPVAIVTGDYLIDEHVMSEILALDARVVFKPLWLDDLVGLAESLVEAHRQLAPVRQRAPSGTSKR
jgi:two-component system chemotaxis response regulator CheY